MTGQGEPSVSRLKIAVFYIIILSFPVLLCFLAVEGYYGYKKMAFPTGFTDSLGKLDGDLGWFHRPSLSTYHVHHAPDGSVAFKVSVKTDVNGFRSAGAGTETSHNAIMFMGDSNSFGFGVEYEDSFPGQTESLLRAPVVVAASPAYGAAQTIFLAERWTSELQPSVLVYFDGGHWERNVCSGKKKPSFIFKPCFWQDIVNNEVRLVTPPANMVKRAAQYGLWPGGMLGVGQDSWSYFLISRPVARVYGILVRLGLVSGFAHDFAAVNVDHAQIKTGVVKRLDALRQTSGVPLVFLDPNGLYADAIKNIESRNLIYVSAEQWKRDVAIPSQQLPADERMVAHDNHWGPGTNRLIAQLIAKEIGNLKISGY